MRCQSLLLYVFIFLLSCNNNVVIKDVIAIPTYPSASGIEYYDKHFYLIGDDANSILLLDSNLLISDSIRLYDFPEKRIPKAIKPDLESIALLKDSSLLLLGSGSISPYRNVGWLINPLSRSEILLQLDTFYQRLQLNGIQELNIEGVCAVQGFVVLANRGNKNYRKNQLIIAANKFWNKQSSSAFSVIPVGTNADSTVFNGISGLAYSQKSDRLIITVSTEDTRNSIDDGEIGKSYLWIISNFSSKLNWKAINPNTIIELEKADQRFKKQKIESATITGETNKFINVVLAVDNDDGSSTLFQLAVEKE